MITWADFWSFFFFLSLALFTCLSIVVAIGGFFNIRSLFKDLSEAKGDGDSPSGDNSA